MRYIWLLWARMCLERSHAYRRREWWWQRLDWPTQADYCGREAERWWMRHRRAETRFLVSAPRPGAGEGGR